MFSLAKHFWILVHQNFLLLKFLLYALPAKLKRKLYIATQR